MNWFRKTNWINFKETLLFVAFSRRLRSLLKDNNTFFVTNAISFIFRKDTLIKNITKLNRGFLYVILLVFVFGFWGCEEETLIQMPKTILSFESDTPFEFERFDKEWFELPQKTEAQKIEFYQAHEDIIDVMSTHLLNIKTQDSLKRLAIFENLAQEKQLRFVFDTTQQLIGNLQAVQDEFQQAINYYKHYFPEKPTPNIKTIISEFGIGSFTVGEDIVGVGLDMYLGNGFPAYAAVGIPKYIQQRMDKSDIVPVSMEVLVDEVSPPFRGSTMMDEMIYKGKKMYLLERLLPTTADSLIWGMSQAQVNWCFENEAGIWTFFAGEDLLYSGNKRDYQKYINPAPNSPGMPENAPGRTGIFIGYKIVHAYMQRFPETTLEALLAKEDYNDFLKMAKYKPSR